MSKFQNVTLTKGDRTRVAESATQLVQLQHDGWAEAAAPEPPSVEQPPAPSLTPPPKKP